MIRACPHRALAQDPTAWATAQCSERRQSQSLPAQPAAACRASHSLSSGRQTGRPAGDTAGDMSDAGGWGREDDGKKGRARRGVKGRERRETRAAGGAAGGER
jgi:hypothetical protein